MRGLCKSRGECRKGMPKAEKRGFRAGQAGWARGWRHAMKTRTLIEDACAILPGKRGFLAASGGLAPIAWAGRMYGPRRRPADEGRPGRWTNPESEPRAGLFVAKGQGHGQAPPSLGAMLRCRGPLGDPAQGWIGFGAAGRRTRFHPVGSPGGAISQQETQNSPSAHRVAPRSDPVSVPLGRRLYVCLDRFRTDPLCPIISTRRNNDRCTAPFLLPA